MSPLSPSFAPLFPPSWQVLCIWSNTCIERRTTAMYTKQVFRTWTNAKYYIIAQARVGEQSLFNNGRVRHCQSRVKWYYAQQSITRFQRRRRPGLVRRMSTHTVQMRRHMHMNYDIIHNLKTDHAWAWAHIARTLWAIPLSMGSHRAYFVSNSFEQSNSF